MSTSDRFFVNPETPLRTVDANQELLASLDRITTHNPPVHTCSTGWTFQGLYSGPTSVAYLFYRLSQKFPDLEFKQQSLFDWAEAYLALGIRLKKKTPDPNHCGIANETLAHLALTAVMQRDAHPVRRICSFEAALNAETEQGSNEWLYGRAGYLYILRLCRTLTDELDPGSSAAGLVRDVIEKTADRILSTPRPWLWHGKPYLGAAHGSTGIICQLALSVPSATPRLRPAVLELLDAQLASGNFPSSAEPPPSTGGGSSSSRDRLVQFCHGGPGFALSLAALAPLWPDLRSRIERAAVAAAADTWRRGLLTKTPCLCHGIAGNALALAEDEKRFAHFLAFMSTPDMERAGWLAGAGRSDPFVGLYTGEAGRAWVWGLAAAEGDGKKLCIGYNDI
ncbi:hypothetical protein GGR52DRAFT_593141 [Hypoxylon sp. FL1284]|nr:hypothetical protein GGR52DRAFT_593141 [Hypoxylon sp. FL1284]